MEAQDVENGFGKLRTRVEHSSDGLTYMMALLPDDFWGCMQCGLVVWDRDIHVKQCPRVGEAIMAKSLFRCPEHSHKCNDENCPDAFTLDDILLHWRRDTERAMVEENVGMFSLELLIHLQRTSPEHTIDLINSLGTLLDAADNQTGVGRQIINEVERIVINAGFEKIN